MSGPTPDPRLLAHHGVLPVLGPRAFVADTARIIGDVHLGPDANVWFGAVVRGDVFHIRIGARVNVQDHTVVHVTTGRHPTIVGDDVTIGHRVTLHGCRIERGALVGMGAIVMDEAVVGEEAMIGAGALVTPGTVIEPRTLAVGSPAKPRRPLTEAELAHLRQSAAHYVSLASTYLAAGFGVAP